VRSVVRSYTRRSRKPKQSSTSGSRDILNLATTLQFHNRIEDIAQRVDVSTENQSQSRGNQPLPPQLDCLSNTTIDNDQYASLQQEPSDAFQNTTVPRSWPAISRAGASGQTASADVCVASLLEPSQISDQFGLGTLSPHAGSRDSDQYWDFISNM
jgi:hypothetical protein